MESFNFIESSIIFGIKDFDSLNRINFSSDDFSNQDEAHKFVLEYADEYQSFPSEAVLQERFPELDKTAIGVDLEYAIKEFRKQISYRHAVSIVRGNTDLLKEDPNAAVGNIVNGLEEILVINDENAFLYSDESDVRLRDYLRKKSQRLKGLKILGIPTNLRSINKTGIGWLPGDMVSVFARPWVGKTWFCIKAAAVAASRGHKTLFISSEMPRNQVEQRLDVILGSMMGYRFSHTALRKGEGIDEEKYKEFLEKTKEDASKLLTCDNINRESISMAGVQSLIRKHKPEFVVLDAVHLLSGGGKGQQVWEKMFNLFYGIKSLCTAQNISFMVSTQANRNAADPYAAPKPGDVAFGDAMYQASDVVLSLSRISEEEQRRLLTLQKYRDGELPFEETALDWDVDYGIIREVGEDPRQNWH